MLDPANFVRVIDNPYYPLPVGRTLVYRGIRDGVTQTDRVHVTSRTKVIEGITATTVTDVATHGRRLLEKTTDWFAQDKQGNVWYLGEDTAACLPGGKIDRSGSWQAGVNDGEPGSLRGKIDRPFGRATLETVHGVGYRITDDSLGQAAD